MPTRLTVNPRDPRHRALQQVRDANTQLRAALSDLDVERDLTHELDVRLALVVNKLLSEDARLTLELDFEHVLKLEMEGDLRTLRGRLASPPPLPEALAARFPDEPVRA